MAKTPAEVLERIRKRRQENREHILAVERACRAKVPLGIRRQWQKHNNLWHCYGLTLDEFNTQYERQGNRCALCRQECVRTPQVDHDHETGRIRGLLCHVCNQGMIAVDRRTDWLSLAQSYTKRG